MTLNTDTHKGTRQKMVRYLSFANVRHAITPPVGQRGIPPPTPLLRFANQDDIQYTLGKNKEKKRKTRNWLEILV